jgi:hypothetical protein
MAEACVYVWRKEESMWVPGYEYKPPHSCTDMINVLGSGLYYTE